MDNDGEYSLRPLSLSIAQIDISNETLVHRDSPPSRASKSIAPIDDLGDVAIKSRAYQLEMLQESLKRNIIVAVCFLMSLLLYQANSP